MLTTGVTHEGEGVEPGRKERHRPEATRRQEVLRGVRLRGPVSGEHPQYVYEPGGAHDLRLYW